MGFVAFLLIAPIIYAVQLIAVQIRDRNEHPVELMMLEDFTGRVAILAIVSAVLLAPAVEELLFRGLFQGWLTRLLAGMPQTRNHPPPTSTGSPTNHRRAPDWRCHRFCSAEPVASPPEAEVGRVERDCVLSEGPQPGAIGLPVLLTSSVFALVHMPQWPAPLAIFLLSLGLGLLYQRTGSLVASFVLHAAFNGAEHARPHPGALNPAPMEKKAVPLPR